MQKKVVTKKKAAPPAVNDTVSTAAARSAPSVATPAVAAATDARVAQQLRVLETVGGPSKGDGSDKYSPRTESHIAQLSDVLDYFQYSRSDIAALVRRCHYEETQIQIAVANIIEDRANHGQTDWGTVKNKKQAKEEKKIKEEEEKKEQERLEKEAEKQRRDAERRAQREQRELERAGRGKGNHKNDVLPAEEIQTAVSALPPDPAILFAGPKPAASKLEQNHGPEDWKDEWWDGAADVANWNGKDWDWQQEKWTDGDWEDGGQKAQAEGDEWWGGEWEKAGGRGRKGKAPAPKKDSSAEIWDMPDASANTEEGGLDQWTLGDIRAAEQFVTEGITRPDAKASFQAVPHGAITLEELERGQLASAPTIARAPANPPTLPPSAAPAPLMAPTIQKPHIDSFPPAPQQDLIGAIGSGAVGSDSTLDASNWKGKGKGKGKGRGERPTGDKPEGEKERLERIDRSDDPRRQAVEEVGELVTVRKHSSMGCAVVSMKDTRVRQAIVALGAEVIINGIKVQVKPHHNKETKEEVLTDIFVAWGRQVEKTTPLSERELTKFFDAKHSEILASWKAAEEAKAREAEERDRQKRLVEEQARQEAALRERAEQRRRYEEEIQLQKRRQDEAQALVDAQKQADQRQTQAKWMSDIQGNFYQAAGATARGLTANGAAAATAVPASTGLHAGAAAYPQQAQQQQAAAAVQQWGAAQQWMQAMAYHSQQGAWQQQMAQRNMQQMQGMTGAAMGQDYETLRQAAYYAYMADQQRGAYTQAGQVQQQGLYQAPAAFNYGAASATGAGNAAAAYGRGERI